MAYKKYIKRGKKIYGPYIYHSRKVKGKVISEYLGKDKNKKKKKKKILIITLAIISLISLFFILNYKNMTGLGISENQSEKSTASIRFVIETTNAEHLDNNKEFMSDIYNEVRKLDNFWSETIPENHYVRVTFEENLTNKNDIKIYPEIISGNPKIEVYEKDKKEKIAESKNLISNKYNKIFLTSLQGEQDTFDLRVLDGSVEIDHIIDPDLDFENFESGFGDWIQDSGTCTWHWHAGELGSSNTGADYDHTYGDTSHYKIGVECSSSVCQGADTEAHLNSTQTYDGDTYAINVSFWYHMYGQHMGDLHLDVYNGTWHNDVMAVLSGQQEQTSETSAYTFREVDLSAYTGDITIRFRYTEPSSYYGDVCLDDLNVTGTLRAAGDTEYPKFSSLTETPSDPATYSSGQSYQFNATITSTNTTAGIEFDGVNYTATNSGNVFSVTISDLPANTGSYNYYWWAFGNGTNTNFNLTTTQTYTINKAALTATITNDRDDTFTYDGTPANIGIDESNNGDADVTYNLYVDNVLKGSTYSQATAGTYNIILNSTGGQNYSSSASLDTKTLTINKAVPQGSISGTSPITYGTAGDVEGTESNSGDADVNYKLYRDNIEVSNPDTTTLAAGTYNYIYNATAGQNYTANASIGTFELTVNQDTGNCQVLFNETSPLTYPESFLVWSDCNSDFTLYRNGIEISNNSVQTLSAGIWNFTVQRTDTVNYSNTYDEELFTINQVTNGATLTLSPSNSEDYGTETTASCSVDYGTPQIYRDDVLISTPDVQTLGAGSYSYVCNVTESVNWTSATDSDTLTINQISSQTSLTFDQASSQTYGTEITPTCSIITGQGSAVLTMDGDVITSGDPLTLGAGTYTFNCSLAESQNYTSSENVSDFTIDKAVPEGSLTSTEGWTITYPIETTISLSESNDDDGDLTYIIYRDGVSISTGETITFGYGTYDYILNTTGGANYTSNASMDAQTLTINQNADSCDIIFNETSPLTYPATFKVWTNCGSDFTLKKDGTTISNNSEQVLSAGIYNFTVERTDTENYSNTYDEELFTISQATGEVNGFINNTQANFTAVDGTANKNIYLNATLTSPCIGTGNIVVNGTTYNSETLPLYNITNLSIGFYNITFNYDGNTNCSSDTEVWWVNITEAPDDPPTISITYPESTTYNVDITELNYTASDDISLSNCWYSLDGGAINSTPDATCSNFIGLESDEGSNTWTVYVNDSKGQEASDDVTFNKDTIYPIFSDHLRNPDPPNEDQDVQMNVTITETNLDTIILEFNGTTNYTVTSSDGNEYYFTIAKGNYTAHDSVTYYWYANDTANNLNKSSQQSFTVSNQIPSVSAPAIDNITPQTNDIISCDGGSFSDSDAEDSEQARYFKWYENNEEISGETSQTLDLSVSGLDKTDEIKCSVRVYDGYDNSIWTNSSNLATIQNSPPTITNPQTTVSWDANGSTYTYDYEATDPDSGDSFTWYDNTTLFNINPGTGAISDTPTEAEAGSHSILINVSDGTDQDTDEFTYTINDVTNPNIQFVSPTETDDSQLIKNNIQVNVTASDGKAIDTITIKLYNSTDLVQTNTSSTSPYFINFTNLPDENYYFNATVNDTSGNENHTETKTVTIDTGAPTMDYVSPTENSGIYKSQDYIEVNVTASDPNLESIVVKLYNLEHTNINSDTSPSSPNFANFTGLSDGLYYYNATANDTFGNENSTETRNITLDTINPSITNLIEFPTDPATYTQSATYQFNATIIDTNLDVVLIEFNNVNYTPTKIGNVYNLTLNDLATGTYNYYWYTNDSAGNVNITAIQDYTINNATGNITLLLNDSATNQIGTYGTQTNASASTLYGTVTLYRDGTDVTSENNDFVTLGVGDYNYTAESSGDQNHSSASITRFVNITQANSAVNLTINGTETNITITQDSSIWLNVTTIIGDSEATLKLYNNGTLINQGNSPLSNLTTFNVIGLFNITGTYIESQNYTDSYETFWVNVTETPDLTNPSVSDLTESPTDSATYSEGATYEFNATITDNRQLNVILIEFDGINYTTSNLIGDIYNFTINNLAVGTYDYRWYVNDTSGNINNSESGTYTINQATPSLSLTISPSTSETYGTETTATGNNCPSQLTCNLYREGVSIDNPETITLGVGTYNYTYNTTGNTNYTSASVSEDLTINQNTGSCDVIFNETSPLTYPESFLVWSDCNSDFTLYRNGIEISNNSVQTLSAGIWNFTVQRTDTVNYSNTYDEELFTISQATGVVYTYINNSRANKTIEQYTEIYLNGTLETGVGNIKLYNNGTLINQDSSPLSNWTNFADIGLYNITTIYDGNKNYTSASETWWISVTEADVTPPEISIIYPENNSYTSIQTQLNYTASDNFGLNLCWYSLNNGYTNTTITCGQNVTGLNSGQGSSTWTVYVNDAKGNENSSLVTFFVDSIVPEIQFVAPTQTDDSSTSENLIEINVSASDTNLESIVIRLYNSSNDLIKTNISTNSPYYINYTGLPAGVYYYNATANDTLNNQNSTETRTISLILPTLTITKPKNATYIKTDNLPLHYSVEYEDSVWYNLDHGSNTTITKENTIFDVFSEGSHTLYLYANNSNGETVKNVTFIINSNKFKVKNENWKGTNRGNSIDLDEFSYEEMQNLSEVILENTNHGKIFFNEVINITNDDEIDLDSYVNISDNKIEINSSALPNLNKSATLYLYNLTFTNPRILKDGVVCPSTICTQESYTGDNLKILKFNVTGFTVYSAEETPSEGITAMAPSPGGGGGSGKAITYECVQDSDCENDEVCWNHKCAKLFDIKIIDFESPIELGEFFDFTYFIKGIANISGDIEINFWIENEKKEKVTSGSDVIYLGNFEEKTETTKIFLPTEIESGVYQFFIEVNYGIYKVKAHRTIEIDVKEGGIDIIPSEKSEVPIGIIIGIIIFILVLIGSGKFTKGKYYKRKRQRTTKKEAKKTGTEFIEKTKQISKLSKEITDTEPIEEKVEIIKEPQVKSDTEPKIKIIKPKQPPIEKSEQIFKPTEKKDKTGKLGRKPEEELDEEVIEEMFKERKEES